MMKTSLPRRAHATRGIRFEPKLRGDPQRERLMIGGAGAGNRFVFNSATAKARLGIPLSPKSFAHFLRKPLKMVGAAGLEPATLSLEDSVSIDYREHMGLRRCILAIETIENTTPPSF